VSGNPVREAFERLEALAAGGAIIRGTEAMSDAYAEYINGLHERAEKAEARVAELEAGIAAIRTHARNKCFHDEMQTDLCLQSIEELCDQLSPPLLPKEQKP
jgi:hypothetical protein